MKLRTLSIFFVINLWIPFLLNGQNKDNQEIELASVDSSIPSIISYQGILSGTSGDPINSSYTMEFSIFNTSEGGSPLWSEEHSSVSIENGVFNIHLGTNSTLSDLKFDEPYWLSISVDGVLLSPRIEFASTPYSFIARTVEDGAITKEKLAEDALQLDIKEVWVEDVNIPQFDAFFEKEINCPNGYKAISGMWNFVSGAIEEYSITRSKSSSDGNSWVIGIMNASNINSRFHLGVRCVRF